MGRDACLKCALKTRTLLNCLKWQIDQLKCRRNKQQLLMQNVLTVWELISQVCLWNNIIKPPFKSHLNPSWSGPTLEWKGQWVREAPRDPHKSGLVESSQNRAKSNSPSRLSSRPERRFNLSYLTPVAETPPRSEQRTRLTYSLPLRSRFVSRGESRSRQINLFTSI